MAESDERVGAFMRKRVIGADALEVLEGIAIVLAHEMDDEGERLIQRIVDRERAMRHMLGMRTEVRGSRHWEEV